MTIYNLANHFPGVLSEVEYRLSPGPFAWQRQTLSAQVARGRKVLGIENDRCLFRPPGQAGAAAYSIAVMRETSRDKTLFMS